MAEVTSGSFNTSAYVTSNGTKRYLTFSWERTSYSIENNTSTISYTLKGAGNYSGWVNTRNIKLVINGTTVYTEAGPVQVYNGTGLKSGTATITHNANGTKSFSASVECGIYYSAINGKGSGTWDLKSIPRTSTVSATNGDIGSTSTITINKSSSSFTHTLTWKCLDLSGTIASKTSASSVNFTIPTSLYAKIPNSPSVKVTVTCETFNGTKSLGTSPCEFTATVNKTNNSPTVTYTSILDNNIVSKNVTKDDTKFIKGISRANITGFKATAKNSATIKTLTIKNGTNVLTLKREGTEVEYNGEYSPITSGKFELTATDSRGYSTTVTHNATMYDYFKPTMALSVQRSGQTGNTVKAEYTGKFCNQDIFKYLRLYYFYGEQQENIASVESTGATVVNKGTFTCNGNDFSGSLTFPEEYDYRQEYEITIYAETKVGTYAFKQPLTRGKPIFDWGENDFNFNVPVTFQSEVIFNVPAPIDDEPAADFVIEQGKKNVTDPNTNQTVAWDYRKWNSGIAECWISRNVNCNVTSKWGTALYYGTVSTINFPFGFVDVPVVNVTCEYGEDEKSLFIASCGFSSKLYARPIMLCRIDSGTFNCNLLYQVMGRWK